MTTLLTKHLDILGLFDRDRLFSHVRFLSELDRTSGTEGEFTAVDYIVRELKGYGLKPVVREFESLLSYPLTASIDIDDPPLSIPSRPRSFSADTGDRAVVGELVHVPVSDPTIGLSYKGGNADYGAVDVRKKIVITEQGGPLGVQAAQRAGALAHIHVWPSPEDVVHEMIASPVWGTPSLHQADLLPRIPSLSVKREDGLALIQRAAGNCRVRLTARTDTRWVRLRLPEVRIGGRTDDWLLIGGHLDSWYQGVTDNATGNASCLELARVLSGLELGRGVRIAWWPGHSTGRYSGSCWFADQHWIDLDDGCVAYVNVDSPGPVGGTDYSEITSMAETAALARAVIKQITGQDCRIKRPSRAGDQSFWGIGLPSLFMLLSSSPPKQRAAVGGSGLNWWWHTPHDTLDKADPDVLLLDTQIYGLTAAALCNESVLPFRLSDMAAELSAAVDLGGCPDLLGPISVELAEFSSRAAAFDRLADQVRITGTDDDARAVNECMRDVQRSIIPVSYTLAGRFEHDPATPVGFFPGLDVIRQADQLGAGDPSRGFALTTAVRERNRIVDALFRSNRTIEHVLGR